MLILLYTCRFNKIYPKPDWATLPSEIKAERKRKAVDSDDSDDENEEGDEDNLNEEDRLDLLKSTMGILNRRAKNLTISPKKLDILRLKNANRAVPKSKVNLTELDGDEKKKSHILTLYIDFNYFDCFPS